MFVVLALVVPASACGYGVNPSVNFKPSFLPLEFSFDFEGNLTVSFSPSLVTPLGVISASQPTPPPGPNDSTLAIRKRHGKPQSLAPTEEPQETVYGFTLHGIQTSTTPLAVQAQGGVVPEAAGNTTTVRVAEEVRELKVVAAHPEQVQQPSDAPTTQTRVSAVPNTSSAKPSASTSGGAGTSPLPPPSGTTGPRTTGSARVPPSGAGHT
ncbi:hypothetical protein [Gandjariella thermophila]|uniref:hypothetical protein n=1 Tax=Gandjariella thermophila TaxID=1931992 RepID=UPI0010F9AC56|nr:hypothetical protein [Gandjariella thermophila]